MSNNARQLLLRLGPLLLALLALGGWFRAVETDPAWLTRNLLPLLLVAGLAGLTIHHGSGTWTGGGWRLPLALLGFAIPTIGLSSYLHYAASVNLDDMFADGHGELFRFLPVYTIGAGSIGFVIGWIVGRNVK
jgi:hypothetical protein